MGSWEVRGAKPHFLGHSVQGGVRGFPPGLDHGVQKGVRGLAARFRPRRTKGGPGGLPPSLGHGVQRVELTHFVTGSVMFFVVFHAFRNLYTSPKTPFLVVIPHILLVLEHKIGCFVVISMVFFL